MRVCRSHIQPVFGDVQIKVGQICHQETLQTLHTPTDNRLTQAQATFASKSGMDAVKSHAMRSRHTAMLHNLKAGNRCCCYAGDHAQKSTACNLDSTYTWPGSHEAIHMPQVQCSDCLHILTMCCTGSLVTSLACQVALVCMSVCYTG